jgi:ubiquinone/menaquinone biosynthesis C-methylase UbiE
MTKRDWKKLYNKVYKEGAHWEKGPSPYVEEFTRYLKKRDKILDAGCGSGRDSVFLAKKGFEVCGIDFSKEAIKKAKEKFGAKNLRFLVGKVENLPFKKRFFDGVYSGYVLQHASLKKTASEIARVLKDGGIAYLIFLLNYKYLSTNKTIKYHKKGDIVSVYKKNFKILKRKEFYTEDFRTKEPHGHTFFIIVLRKKLKKS